MILYSFIIPVYNAGNYLEKCLHSILGQSYKNWEAILIDDGSTDGVSSSLCDKYAKKDTRIRVYHRKNEGSLIARRYGLKQAAGDYFLFVDSDDYLHQDLLLTVNTIIAETQSDLVAFRFQRVGGIKHDNSPIVFKEGTIIGENGLSKELIWKKVISGCELNNLVLKAVKRENIDIDADYSAYAFLKSGTDLLQCLPIIANSKKIYFTEKVLYYYQYNSTGISSSKMKQTDRESIKLQIKTLNTLQSERLKYLEKLNYVNPENLKLFYNFCFESLINMLICWLKNEKSPRNRRWLIREVLNNQIMSEAIKYIQLKDVSRKYKIIYRLAAKRNNKVEIPLMVLATRSRLSDLLCSFLILWKDS